RDRAAVERDVLTYMKRFGTGVRERARVLDERAHALDALAACFEAEPGWPATVVAKERRGRGVAKGEDAAARLDRLALVDPARRVRVEAGAAREDEVAAVHQ